jgi:hypothetical protein
MQASAGGGQQPIERRGKRWIVLRERLVTPHERALASNSKLVGSAPTSNAAEARLAGSNQV